VCARLSARPVPDYRTRVTGAFTTTTTYDAAHPTALAVYCSDGRITHAVEELLRELGHARLDTVTFPGGPGLLNHRTSGFSDCDTFSRAAEFLIREHHITDVVLLAHDGCGFYKRKFPDLSAEQIHARQLADLRLARDELASTHPRLHVVMYLAIPDHDRVRFEIVG
jgi:hypothetical protein